MSAPARGDMVAKRKVTRVKEKATGWKAPLIFCAIVVIIVTCGWFVLKGFRYEPRFAADLLELAAKTRVDMDAPANERWKKAIVAAASGFAPAYEKDKKLEGLSLEALAADNPEAAIAAAAQTREPAKKDEILEKIFNYALEDCGRLPRAPGLVKAMKNVESAKKMEARLAAKWERCREALTK